MQSPPHILVVDDDKGLQLLFRRCLQLKGYQVQVAGNGEEALVAIASEKPDLILLDLMMPVMDGIQFARTFHERYGYADTPIIVVSAADDAKRHAEEIEADAMISKPFGIHELLDLVDHHLH